MADVQEQACGVSFLRNVVEGRLTCPLLLVGNEGVGRKFSVVEAAREAFSKGELDSIHSLQIDRGVHPDLLIVSASDGKSIGIDAVREVIELSGFIPQMASRRYVVLDGVDTMTTAAANAFLKILEEPPSSTRFFLLAESLSEVLPTIRSRCGIVRYVPLSEDFIIRCLMQHTEDATKALVCARLSEGSVGRAVQYLCSGRLALRNSMVDLLRKGLTGDLASLFAAVNEIPGLHLGIRFLEHVLYDLVMLPHDPAKLSNVDIIEDLRHLRDQIGEARLTSLLAGLRLVQRRQSASINLGFHVKTCLTTTFVG